MWELRGYLKGYTKEAVCAPLFKMLEVFFDLMVPLVVARIINVGVGNENRGVIFRCVLLLVGLALMGMVAAITAQFFAAKASVGFGTQLRQALFDHIQGLSYTELDRLGTSSLVTRLTDDVNQVQTGLNQGLRLLLRSPIVVVGSMVMAFTVNVRCALIFAAAIPVLFIVTFGIMYFSIPLFSRAQHQLDRITLLTRENLTGVRVIRAFCRERESVEEFDEANRRLTALNEFVGRLSALLNPLTFLLINFATILLIRRGAIEVNLGAMQQGDVVALYNYMAQMIIELIKLAALIITLNKSLACADRVAEVLRVQSSMAYPESGAAAEASAAADEAVRFDHVTFTYEGAGAPSLTDISFSARRGETIGIIGGTGSGKSSLVGLIARFYDPEEGTVFVDGRDARSYTAADLNQKMGIVPQKAVLFRGTVRDNLRWGDENATDEQLWAALETAQAKEVVEGKEGGLDFEIEQGGRNLSGGQKQRLTIARALVRRPEILLLDDSASALDFATDAALRQALRQLKDVTTFIISQRTSSIRSCDQILVLGDGALVGIGTHDELMESCAEYQEIYYSQFPEERPKTPAGKAGGNKAGGKATDNQPAAGKEARS